jgi:hypothetical protein
MPLHAYRGLIATIALLHAVAGAIVHAQAAAHTVAISPQQAIDLAHSGRCEEALPPLRRMAPQISDKTVRYNAGISLVRCAMALDQEQTAADALLQLKHDEPNNPEVLYLATHYFSELGMRAAQQSHWLGIKLIGTRSNVGAIGAQIIYQRGALKRQRTKVGGGSYLSSHDPRIVLGLGGRTKIDWLEIRWPKPGTTISRLTGLPIDRYITITEGQNGWK